MTKPQYTIQDYEEYLIQKQHEFIAYRKNGLEYVNKKLIELGKTLGDYPDIWKIKSNRVVGCTSNVYIHASLVKNKIIFSGSSDSDIIKGQLALLINSLNMLNPEDIINNAETQLNNFVNNTDVRFSMTISRANSLGKLYQFMKKKAESFLN